MEVKVRSFEEILRSIDKLLSVGNDLDGLEISIEIENIRGSREKGKFIEDKIIPDNLIEPEIPPDWVYDPENKRYYWDDSVTSPADVKGMGVEYVGPGKNDAFSHWYNGLNAFNKWRSRNDLKDSPIDWNSYYASKLKKHALRAFEEERNRKVIPLTPEDEEWNKTMWGDDQRTPKVSTYVIDMQDELYEHQGVFGRREVFFDIIITINGERIKAKGIYYSSNSNRQYITKIQRGRDKGQKVMGPQWNNYSLLLGNDIK